MKLSFLFLISMFFPLCAFSTQTNTLSDLLINEQWAIKNSTRLSPIDNTTPIGTCKNKPSIQNNQYTCSQYNSPGVNSIDINAEVGWQLFSELPQTQEEVVVGLIDTGIDYLHPDLQSGIWLNPGEALGTDNNSNGIDDGCEDGTDNESNGYIDDCHGINTLVEKSINGEPNPLAGNPIDNTVGHGTNMAGVILASGNNGSSTGSTFHGGVIGVAGLTSNVKIATCAAAELKSDVYLTIPGGQGLYGTPESITACLDYFADLKERGVNVAVVNGSGGASAFNNLIIARGEIRTKYRLNTQEVKAALIRLNALNIPVITAAGNNGWSIDNDEETTYYPASFALDNIISVAAINNQGDLWNNSSFGRWTVDIAAPGASILSTNPRIEIMGSETSSDYIISSGTSQATALVTGIVALLKANTNTALLSPVQIKRLLLSSGKSLESLKQTTRSGQLVQLAGIQGKGALSCNNQVFQRRHQPQQNNLFRIPGETIYLEIHKYRCSEASTDTSITVTVTPTGQLITLLDNGTSPDVIAGDGIYSGNWTVPNEILDYQLNLGVDSVTQTPDTIDVSSKVIVDNASPNIQRSGWWWPSIYRSGFYAHNYRYAAPSSSTQRTYSWKPEVPVSGYYKVYTMNPANSGFATNAQFTVFHQSPTNNTTISTQHSIDQTQLSGQWKLLGTHWFNQGEQTISLSNLHADGTVIADAVMLQFTHNEE